VVTGGGGSICGEIARALAGEGASVAIWDLSLEAGRTKLDALPATQPPGLALACDVLERDSVRRALEGVLRLNYLSAVIPSQEVGRIFAEKKAGVILNIASVAALRPLTRSIAYSNGKAATVSFTSWLAVHMAREYSPAIRVNAVAPGFILTEQNRFLLLEGEGGGPSERGKRILEAVPMRRLGRPEEIAGAVLYLVSEQARFVTGAVLAVDGGFSANPGV